MTPMSHTHSDRATPAINSEHALHSAALRLATEFDGVFGRETIDRFLHTSYTDLAARAAVDNFLPLLTEKFARQRLRALARIRRGKAAGLTLAQIRGILQIRDRGQAPCRHVRNLLDAHLAGLDAQIAELVSLRADVVVLRDRATAPDPDSCDPDSVCRYL